MDAVTLLINSLNRTTGVPNNFTIVFDLGISISPEIVRILEITITPSVIPPSNVIYLCSNILSGYSNGFYPIGLPNNNNIIGPYCVIAVIPITSLQTINYKPTSISPFFTCMGTVFGKKNTDQTSKNLTFMLINNDGTPSSITGDYVFTIECRLLYNSLKP